MKLMLKTYIHIKHVNYTSSKLGSFQILVILS